MRFTRNSCISDAVLLNCLDYMTLWWSGLFETRKGGILLRMTSLCDIHFSKSKTVGSWSVYVVGVECVHTQASWGHVLSSSLTHHFEFFETGSLSAGSFCYLGVSNSHPPSAGVAGMPNHPHSFGCWGSKFRSYCSYAKCCYPLSHLRSLPCTYSWHLGWVLFLSYKVCQG